MVGGFKKQRLEGFFFWWNLSSEAIFTIFFGSKSCWGDWIVKSVCSFFQTSGRFVNSRSWGKRHRTSPLLGKTKAPKGLESDDSSEATGLKKGQKRLVFVVKKRGGSEGEVGKPPKFGQEVGRSISLRSPPSNKKLWDKKHQTQISYIVFIYVYLEPICRLFLGLNHHKQGPFPSKQE